MFKKIFLFLGFLVGMSVMVFMNVSECPAQGMGGLYGYPGREADRPERPMVRMSIELNGF